MCSCPWQLKRPVASKQPESHVDKSPARLLLPRGPLVLAVVVVAGTIIGTGKRHIHSGKARPRRAGVEPSKRHCQLLLKHAQALARLTIERSLLLWQALLRNRRGAGRSAKIPI